MELLFFKLHIVQLLSIHMKTDVFSKKKGDTVLNPQITNIQSSCHNLKKSIYFCIFPPDHKFEQAMTVFILQKRHENCLLVLFGDDKNSGKFWIKTPFKMCLSESNEF